MYLLIFQDVGLRNSTNGQGGQPLRCSTGTHKHMPGDLLDLGPGFHSTGDHLAMHNIEVFQIDRRDPIQDVASLKHLECCDTSLIL